MYDLVIATTTCFRDYGHATENNRRLYFLEYATSLTYTKWCGKKVLTLLSNNDRGGWNDNYHVMLDNAGNLAPLCIIVDSDANFRPGWLSYLLDLIRDYPDAAGWSLYNSPHYARYFTKELAPGILEHSHAGPFGLCYRTEDRVSGSHEEWFESFIGDLPKKHSMGFVGPKVSMIQHIGRYGLNNAPGHSEDFDPNFEAVKGAVNAE